MPSIFFMGVVGIPSLKDKCSGSPLTGPPNMYFPMWPEGEVSSGW